MTKPVIAFDCDDVIVATGDKLSAQYNQLHGTAVKPAEFYSKDYERVWQAEPELAIRDLFAYLLTEEAADQAPMAGAVETLRHLSESYSLHIVTGRPDFAEEATTRWVAKFLNGIFTSVVFTNFFKVQDSKGALRTKADVCRELGAAYLVDDHLHHIQNVTAQGITGLWFGTYPWEQAGEQPTGSVRIADWDELREFFDKIN